MRQVIGLFLSAAIALPAVAARNVRTSGDLLIDHRRMAVFNETRGEQNELRNKLEASNSYLLSSGESVSVVVQDPNPLIFTYDWTKKPGEETTDFKNAKAFAAVLKSFGTTLEGLVPEATEEAGDVDENIAADAEDAGARVLVIAPNSARVLDLTGMSKKERRKTLASFLREELGITPAFLSAASKRLKDLGDYLDDFDKIALASVAESAETFEAEKDRAATILKSVVAARQDLQTIKNYHLRLATGDIAEILKKAGLTLEDVDSSSFSPDDVNATLRTLAISSEQEDLKKSIDAAEDLANRVKKVNEPLFLGELAFNATQTDPALLKVGTTESFDDLPAKARQTILKASGAQAGEFAFIAAPYSPVTFGMGPTMIYSFTERPKYETRAEGDKFRIVRTDEGDDLAGFDIGAMLTLTPTAWRNEIFEPQIQIGIAPGDENVGIFGGVGFVLYRNVTLGGGIAYERVEELVPGLRERDLLNAADELKTSEQFKTGFYLNLSVTFDLN